jgi:hypothetical protein
MTAEPQATLDLTAEKSRGLLLQYREQLYLRSKDAEDGAGA